MIRVALAQMNQVVGDIDGNMGRILETLECAATEGAQLVVTPELAVPGYPPEDLLLKPEFLHANRHALEQIAAATGDVLTIVGFVDEGRDRLYNAAAICQHGRVMSVYRKHLLPNYGVFDEFRYFEQGRGHTLVDTPDGIIGVCVCEDAWSNSGPVTSQGDAGAQIIVNINASPFHKNKLEERTEMLAERARRARASIVYVNTVGGQDELVFDGGSLVIDPDGEVVARWPQFTEHFGVVEVPLGEAGHRHHPSIRRLSTTLPALTVPPPQALLAEPSSSDEEIYEALRLALHDYVIKNGFRAVVVGLSGGIDSTLTAALAVDAVGPNNVLGVLMPSMFTSQSSLDDARTVAGNLAIETKTVAITETYEDYVSALDTSFDKHEPGLAEENIQARIRGNLLMAISNRYGHLVLATGNKSEMACGYSTLYGDMAGGFAVLKDVLKTEVYALCRWRNKQGEVIPESVLTKAPSAELRAGQQDEDSLGPYAELDEILEGYIEQNLPVEDIIAAGHERAVVERVMTLVDRAEYKRRQAPPGPKVTTKAFGRDRRLPITNRWRPGRSDLPARSVGEAVET